MRVGPRVSLVVLLSAMIGTSAQGQQLCGQHGSYHDCALSLQGDQLFRGVPSAIVTMGLPLSPIALTSYVRGDSAMLFARRYERESAFALRTRFVGGGTLFFTSLMVLATGRTHGPSRAQATAMIGGGTLLLLSHPLKWFAARDGERAVAAYNRGLSR
jgi:hypothetical protein